MALYSQRDARWAGQRLGTLNGATIGAFGCYMTSLAMSATNYGIDVTPAQLDDIFTANMDAPFSKGGYVSGDLCWDGMLAKVYPDKFAYVGSYNCPGNTWDINVLAPYDVYGMEAILEVDFDHNPNDGLQTHFVRMYAFNGGDPIIDDPWYGDRVVFSKRYGSPVDNIYKAVFYKAILPTATSPVVSTPAPVNVEPIAVITQPSVATTAVEAATAETALQNPVVSTQSETPTVTQDVTVASEPDYVTSFVSFKDAEGNDITEDKKVIVESEAIDLSGQGEPKPLHIGQLVKLKGSCTHEGKDYYMGTSGQPYGVPVGVFAFTGQVRVNVVKEAFIGAETAASEVFAAVAEKAGVFKRIATFLRQKLNHWHNN